MTAILRRLGPPSLSQQLRAAPGMTRRLMFEVIDKACQRVRLPGHSERTGRLMRLIDAGAWTDAALALMELELPLWQVRRLAYDAGEWHCALSRRRELPDWLDQPVESGHPDLAVAVLSAFRRGPANQQAAGPAPGRSVRCQPALEADLQREFQVRSRDFLLQISTLLA